MTDVELDVEAFTGAEYDERFEVQVDGRAYVVAEDTLRAFLSDGLRALGHDGTEAWRVEP